MPYTSGLKSIALACTIFIFFRQGLHFQNGMLILGRRRG
jgi:hypothetical protein